MAKARGTGRVFLRGKTWWVAYYVNGKEERESSHSTREGDAARLLKQRLGAMGRGQPVGAQLARTTFEDLARGLLDHYRINGRRSLDRVEEMIRLHLRPFFGRDKAAAITADRIAAYTAARLDDQPAPTPATVNRELSALRRMFRLGERAGLVGSRPYIGLMKEGNVRTGFFEGPELQAVLARLPAALRPALEFAALTGWRIGEVLPLTWRQVDFAAGVVRLEPGTTKNQDGRTFPFAAHPALAALLERQRAATEVAQQARGAIIPWVFHRDGRPVRTYAKAWRRACAAAGLPGRLVHDLRRTAVRNLERAGVPRSVAMKLTGHKTESVYRRYAIVSEADLAEGVAKLAARQAVAEPQARTVVPLRATAEARTRTEHGQLAARVGQGGAGDGR